VHLTPAFSKPLFKKGYHESPSHPGIHLVVKYSPATCQPPPTLFLRIHLEEGYVGQALIHACSSLPVRVVEEV
jgi:hypothetical protein